MPTSPLSTSSMRMWRYFAPHLLEIRDFSGGLNLRDAEPELAANESPDLMNVTLDERGGVSKRLGYTKYNATAFSGGLVQNTRYIGSLSCELTQAGAAVYKDTTNTARLTWSTSARGDFCDFQGKAWAVHPIDGVYSSTDGVTWGAVAGSPKGTSIAAWQNRILVCGDPAQPQRVYASGIGDGTNWLTTAGNGWTNDLRETRDGQTLLGFAAASGVDIIGRPGIVVGKRDSLYRIYDSNTGAYQTISPDVGPASSLAMTTALGQTVIVSRSGIYSYDGAVLKKVSARVDPLFATGALNEAQLDLVCAGSYGARAYCSIPRTGASANDLALEYHALEGWITAGTNAASCYATYGNQTRLLLAGSPTVSGRLYQQFTGGSDDGTAITSWFQTKWFEPAAGFLCRIGQGKTLGHGNYTLLVKHDYEQGQGLARAVSIPTGGFVWGTGVWGTGTWGPATYVGYSSKLLNLGACRSVSFKVYESGTTSTTSPLLLESGAGLPVGAWGLSGVDAQWRQLGMT